MASTRPQILNERRRGIVVVVDRALAELGRGLVQDTRWLYGVVRCAVGAVFIL